MNDNPNQSLRRTAAVPPTFVVASPVVSALSDVLSVTVHISSFAMIKINSNTSW